MRVVDSPEKPVAIEFTRTVESSDPNTDCNDTERSREERLLAEFMEQVQVKQQHNGQFVENDLLRKFFDEIDHESPYCDNAGCVDAVLQDPKNDSLDAGLSQVSTNASQPEMDLNRLIGECAQGNSKQSTWNGEEMGFDAHQHLAGPSGDLPLQNNQAEQQRLLMLQLQNQFDNLTVLIQQEQDRQKLRENENPEMQTNAPTARESAASTVNEAESMRMQSENADIEIVSTNNSPPLCVLNQLTDGMGSGVRQNVSELQLLDNQAEQQRLMILDLQKQLHNLNVLIQQLQYKQEILEKDMRDMQALIAQEAAAKEARSIRMHLENDQTGIVSPNNPPLYVPNQLNSIDGLESMHAHSRQCTQKRTITRSNDTVAADAKRTRRSKTLSRHSGQTNRVDQSERSLRNEKQVRSDVAAERDRVLRGKSSTFSCVECGKEFDFKGALIKHLRVHSGEKPFKCTDCGTSFSQKSNLTVHKRIHTGSKPFKCQICNVKFNQKHHLIRHLLIHTNEKPFVCDICNRSFRRKGLLSDHMNIHSGNRPHKCNVCQKTFRQRHHLYSHRKVHAE